VFSIDLYVHIYDGIQLYGWRSVAEIAAL